MITSTEKVHLSCDCVRGSIVSGIGEQLPFSFNISAFPGYEIIKESITVLYKKQKKKQNKIRQDAVFPRRPSRISTRNP